MIKTRLKLAINVLGQLEGSGYVLVGEQKWDPIVIVGRGVYEEMDL